MPKCNLQWPIVWVSRTTLKTKTWYYLLCSSFPTHTSTKPNPNIECLWVNSPPVCSEQLPLCLMHKCEQSASCLRSRPQLEKLFSCAPDPFGTFPPPQQYMEQHFFDEGANVDNRVFCQAWQIYKRFCSTELFALSHEQKHQYSKEKRLRTTEKEGKESKW